MVIKERVQVSELKSHIGFWMRFVSNNVSLAFSNKLESCDVTVAEWVILRVLYSICNKTSVSHIADLTALTRGAVSKLISRLLDKKLITRKESELDRRFQDVELTDIGIMLVPELAMLADKNDEEFFSVLTGKERKVLTDLLKKLTTTHKFITTPIN